MASGTTIIANLSRKQYLHPDAFNFLGLAMVKRFGPNWEQLYQEQSAKQREWAAMNDDR